MDESDWKELEVVFPESLEACFETDELAALKGALALDPRPAYSPDDDKKKYGLAFAGRNIRFSVSDGVLSVLDVSEC